MSIEEKIAKLMEEAKKLETASDLDESEEISEEEFNDLDEETQSLYELSVDTMNAYRKKALGSIDKKLASKDVGGAMERAGKTATASMKIKAKGGTPVQREEYEGTIDLGSLFEGEEFSEEFKTKAAELFEAAVEARIKQEVVRIEEELSQRSLDESVELKEGLVDKVDGYLDYVVEQWMQKNELALDRGIKVEIFESFVSGMKDLFETHYIDVPEEKFDLMESVDAKAKTLEEQVDFLTAQNVELQQKFKTVAKEKQIEEACKELTDLEAERFKQLSEELAYDDEESFGKKLELVKENYISKAKQAKSVIVESVVTDSPVELNEEKQVEPSMARYMTALKAR